MAGGVPATASSSPTRRRKPMLHCDKAMFTGVENCWRIELADSALEARAWVGSRSITSAGTPWSRARKQAVAAPIAPPPTITTLACIVRVYSSREVHAALPWEPLAQALGAAFVAGAQVPLRHVHALSEQDRLLL